MSKYLIPAFTAAVGVAVLVALFVSPPAGQPERLVYRFDVEPRAATTQEGVVRRRDREDAAGAPGRTPAAAPSGSSADSARAAEGVAETAQGPSGPEAAASPASTGGARTLALDDAMRELSLIRPSREKLAHDFSLKTAAGKTFRLSEHRGKVVFINFWATWCPPCREEMPAMDRLYRKHRDRGFVMVAVSVDTDPAAVKPFLDEHDFAFAVALDPKMEAANAYAVRALPSSFIVDARGMMTALALGPRVWDNTAAHALIERLAAR